MTWNELVADSCERNVGMLKMTLADFSDQEMCVRPAPAANHAAWQTGHVVLSECMMVNAVSPGAIPELPAGFAERFSRETAKLDDPGAFASKQQLLEVAARTRAAAAQWIRKLTPEQLAKPAPEVIRGIAPTVGHLVLLLSQHMAMHVGQMQVIRRKLGKPVLF